MNDLTKLQKFYWFSLGAWIMFIICMTVGLIAEVAGVK